MDVNSFSDRTKFRIKIVKSEERLMGIKYLAPLSWCASPCSNKYMSQRLRWQRKLRTYDNTDDFVMVGGKD
jgi:hypothetical protein